MSVDIRWQEEHMDWKPLEAVVGDGAADWMWMHTVDAPDTGAAVHFYKHIDSRRYLRLDAEGRVYREERGGTPRPLPGCGGATLLLQLIAASVFSGLPETITLPEAARTPCTADDLRTLDQLSLLVSDEFRELGESLGPAREAVAAYGRHAPGTAQDGVLRS